MGGLWCPGLRVATLRVRSLTQGVALGCDMAAPLALSKNSNGNSRFPSGMENKKSNGNGKSNSNSNGKSNSEYGDLSTAHDMKPSCFGRDDKGLGWVEAKAEVLEEEIDGRD